MSDTTPKPLMILTGSSRGLGLAIGQQWLAQGGTLLGIARHTHESLPQIAQHHSAHVEQWVQDLSDPLESSQRLERWLSSLHPFAVSSAILVNNAGVMPRIGPLDECPLDELSQALRVGLETPMALTAGFIRVTQRWVDGHWQGQRKVLNLSSGWGRRASAGQAPYCAAKAGLDHFSRCTALDEARKPHGVRIVSLAPGVIETGMQMQLRNSDPRGFPERERYVSLHQNGLLDSPTQCAKKILTFLASEAFGLTTIADLRT